MSRTHIRRPEPSDARTLRRLVLGFLNFHRDIGRTKRATPREAAAALRSWRHSRHRRFFVLQLDDHVVGFTVLRKEPGEPVFWGEELYVDPRFRGRGVGRAAIRFAEKYVVHHGGDALYLSIAAHNLRMLGVAHRLGYRRLNMVELRKDLPVGRARRAGRRVPVRAVSLSGIRFQMARPGKSRH